MDLYHPSIKTADQATEVKLLKFFYGFYVKESDLCNSIMKTRITVLFLFILVSSLQSFAQGDEWLNSQGSSPSPSKGVILYDPSFWKDELKLSSAQQQQIDKINADFYENIKLIYSKKESSYTNEIAQLLVNRSEQIWGTFHHRQKRKWEKLDSLNSLHADSERSQSAF